MSSEGPTDYKREDRGTAQKPKATTARTHGSGHSLG